MAETQADLYLAGLRNAHAIEAMATEMLEKQIDRLEHYPEIAQALRTHLAETREQSARLEAILHAHGSDYSSLKEGWMTMAGNMSAMFHGMMQDEIMKNHFANAAVEAYEIAMYTSLIALAEENGDHAAIPHLQESLAEEEKTEKLVQSMTRSVTRQYVARATAGEMAGV